MKKLLIAWMICLVMGVFAQDKKPSADVQDKKPSVFAQEKKSSANVQEKKALSKAVWSEDFAKCQELAQKSGKPIFALFTGSDWCIWCKRLEGEVLSQKAFLDYAASDLILFKADFPQSIKQIAELKQQNQNLQQKYGIRGYPTVLLLDEKGTVIGKTGYRKGGPDDYVKNLKQMLQK